MFRASFNRHGGGAFCGTTQRLFSMGARSVNLFGKEVSKKSCNRARDSATTHGFIDPCFFLSSSISTSAIAAMSALSSPAAAGSSAVGEQQASLLAAGGITGLAALEASIATGAIFSNPLSCRVVLRMAITGEGGLLKHGAT